MKTKNILVIGVILAPLLVLAAVTVKFGNADSGIPDTEDAKN